MKGHWENCLNPFRKIEHGFKAYPKFPFNQGVCGVCWYEMLRMENPHTPLYLPMPLVKGRPDSKPESDTL